MKRWFLSLFLLTPLLISCDRFSTPSRIYFLSELDGSVAINIFSVDEKKNLVRHTYDDGAREIDYALDKAGNMILASNRVQSWETYYNTPAKNRKNKYQYFNAFYLPKGASEKHDKDRVAKALTNDHDQIIKTDISADGRWVSVIKVVEPPEGKRYDLLAIIDRQNSNNPIEVERADMITSARWSPDSKQLLFTSHTFVPREANSPSAELRTKASLKLFDLAAKTGTLLLDDPFPEHELTSAQWAPNGQFISLIAHPLEAGKVRKLYVMNFKTRELKALSADNAQVQEPVSWAKDSQRILYGALIDYKQDWSDELREKVYTGSGQIFITDLNGVRRQITQGDKQVHTRPTFSPDNTKIAYLYADQFGKTDMQLRIADLEGNTLDTLYDKAFANSHLIWQ